MRFTALIKRKTAFIFHLRLWYRYMFVTDWGDLPKIERIGMDGTTKRKVIIKTGKSEIKNPKAIAIDMKTETIYWADEVHKKIEYMNIDGKEGYNIYLQKYSPPHYLIVHNKHVYWSDGKKLIYSMRDDNDSTITPSDKFLGEGNIQPYGLAFVSKKSQPKGSSKYL